MNKIENCKFTFKADERSLKILNECEEVHINSMINFGLKLVEENVFYQKYFAKQTEEQLNTKPIIEDDVMDSTESAGVVQPITQAPQTPPNNIALQTPQSPQNPPDEMDFSSMFN